MTWGGVRDVDKKAENLTVSQSVGKRVYQSSAQFSEFCHPFGDLVGVTVCHDGVRGTTRPCQMGHRRPNDWEVVSSCSYSFVD